MREPEPLNPVDITAALTRAVAIANVPTLLMVLVQMTGKLEWLQEPFLALSPDPPEPLPRPGQHWR